jgi:hypothetical protein
MYTNLGNIQVFDVEDVDLVAVRHFNAVLKICYIAILDDDVVSVFNLDGVATSCGVINRMAI